MPQSPVAIFLRALQVQLTYTFLSFSVLKFYTLYTTAIHSRSLHQEETVFPSYVDIRVCKIRVILKFLFSTLFYSLLLLQNMANFLLPAEYSCSAFLGFLLLSCSGSTKPWNYNSGRNYDKVGKGSIWSYMHLLYLFDATVRLCSLRVGRLCLRFYEVAHYTSKWATSVRTMPITLHLSDIHASVWDDWGASPLVVSPKQ